MIIDHVAIWTDRLEELKDFYTKYFDGQANEKYVNKETHFESYFISFCSGARLELMKKPGIAENMNDTVIKQHLGIIHIAFNAGSVERVIELAGKFENNGIRILRGPRKTGDGYFEFETTDPDNNRIEVISRLVG